MLMLQEHEKTCGYFMVKCTSEGCIEDVERRELENHLRNCIYRLVDCEYCTQVNVCSFKEIQVCVLTFDNSNSEKNTRQSLR